MLPGTVQDCSALTEEVSLGRIYNSICSSTVTVYTVRLETTTK